MEKKKRILLSIIVACIISLALIIGLNVFGKQRKLNVLLITLDTTRADRIGAYGYEKGSTPNLDALASEGVLFESAFSQVPLTLPSHCSILTGTVIPYHKVRNNGYYALPPQVETLAEILKRSNYTTAAFVSSAVLDSRFGIGRGFDVYNDNLDVQDETINTREPERNAEAVYRAFADWFNTIDNQLFFSWVHFFDPHMYYRPPEPYLSRFKDNPYDGEIAYMDEYIGKILELLKNKNCLKDTLVVIVGDHGEAFGEHGEFGHQVFCYNENLKVPFILCGSGLPRKKRVGERVDVTDVTPTILDYLGIPGNGDKQGISLLPLIKGSEMEARGFYIESVFPAEALGCAEVRGWVENGYKYIDLPQPELYHLTTDPGESENLYLKKHRLAKQMKQKMAAYLKPFESVRFSSTRVPSDEERKKLASLGYLTTVRPKSSSVKLLDPKEIISTWTLFNKGEALLNQEDEEGAIRIFTEVLKTNPKFSWTYGRLAILYGKKGNHQRAVNMFKKGMQVNPWDDILTMEYANYLISQSEFYDAFALLKKLEKSGSYKVSVRVNKAIAKILSIREYYSDALPYYEKILQVEPENLYIKKMVGFCLYKSGRLSEALTVYLELDKLGKVDPEVLFITAVIAGQLEKYEIAESSFSRLLKVKETSAIYFNFAMVLAKLGKWKQAVEKLRKFDQLYTENDRRKEEARRLIREWTKIIIAPKP